MTAVNKSFIRQIKSMLRVDFRRMFISPLVYIMAGVSLAMPILILVMTTMLPSVSIDPVTGEEAAMETFTNVWQAIGSVSGEGQMSMDITSMCNINMLYFLVPVLVCIFIGEDFRSGYAKNLFTVRSKRTDYVLSKTVVGFAGSVIMLGMYFVGAMIGGAIAELPFSVGTAGVSGIVMCMLSKVFLAMIFVAISVLMGVVAKQRLWLSIVSSFAASMLLFTMVPMISPLNSTFINVIMCLAGGAMFAVGLGVASRVILHKTSLV